ncbi:MAG: esterase family protein [Candidatus Kapabacteria bacterium]|nr:esterase family protein [Candidatus Kapabacteria bacterium]
MLTFLVTVLGTIATSLIFAQSAQPSVISESLSVYDSARSRRIGVQMYTAAKKVQRPANRVVMLSAGYSERDTTSHRGYSFIANSLAERGFIVLSVQHELPNDEPIATEGNIYELRMPAWKRGVENLLFVRQTMEARLKKQFPKQFLKHDWKRLVLIGHSMGGDISMLCAKTHPEMVSEMISFDHRRMPVLRVRKPRILSLRGTDFPADNGVLPSADEQKRYGIVITTLPNAKHGDFTDSGNEAVKKAAVQEVMRFLNLR